MRFNMKSSHRNISLKLVCCSGSVSPATDTVEWPGSALHLLTCGQGF